MVLARILCFIFTLIGVKSMQNMNIPSDILQAAQDLEDFFVKQGFERWALMGVCSRNHADELAKERARREELFEEMLDYTRHTNH